MIRLGFESRRRGDFGIIACDLCRNDRRHPATGSHAVKISSGFPRSPMRFEELPEKISVKSGQTKDFDASASPGERPGELVLLLYRTEKCSRSPAAGGMAFADESGRRRDAGALCANRPQRQTIRAGGEISPSRTDQPSSAHPVASLLPESDAGRATRCADGHQLSRRNWQPTDEFRVAISARSGGGHRADEPAVVRSGPARRIQQRVHGFSHACAYDQVSAGDWAAADRCWFMPAPCVRNGRSSDINWDGCGLRWGIRRAGRIAQRTETAVAGLRRATSL